jgi:hypothetical protein
LTKFKAAKYLELCKFLTSQTRYLTINLESAAFVFHISGTTLERITWTNSSGHREPRVLSPLKRFLACPFS